MDNHIRKVYVPMTETGYYILLNLIEPTYGYDITNKVKEMTDGEIVIGPGTMYGSLSKMEKDGLIKIYDERDNRKIYLITELGQEVLKLEKQRIKRLYRTLNGE